MKILNLEYDKEADAAYIALKKLAKGEIKSTIELNNNIILDFDKDKKLVGIEVLNASKVMPEKVLSKVLTAS